MLLVNLTALTTLNSFGKSLHLFLYQCFAVVCLTALIALIPWQRARKVVQGVLIGLSVVLLFTDIYFACYYQGLPDQAIMEVLIATTAEEAWGYVRANLLNIWIIGGLVVGLGLVYLLFHFVVKLRYVKGVVRTLSYVLLVASLFTIGNMVKDVFKHKDKTVKSLTHNCCSVLRTGTQFYEGWTNMRNFERVLHRGNLHPRLLKNSSSIPYVVFILGESTSRHHLGIYGYPLNTTPYMAARERSGNLVKFTDVISPHGQTMPALGKLFTFYRHGAKGAWYDYTDLFSILNEAGYHTVWLSNQEFSGIYGNNGRVYAERCSEYAFTKLRGSDSYTIKDPYDEEILPLLDKSLKGAKAKNFIVLHLMGTHQNYKFRFPETFRSFSATEEKGENDKIKQTRADYDTAVRYNDSIMNDIIKRFEDKNAVVIYVSDHAEDVMEINKKIAGHSEIGLNRRMVEIPMMVFTSKRFQTAYPMLTARIRNAANRPFETDDMIHALLDLMDIHTADYKPQLSVFNQHFDAKRTRYYGTKKY